MDIYHRRVLSHVSEDLQELDILTSSERGGQIMVWNYVQGNTSFGFVTVVVVPRDP